jgi:hypothetical protein
MIERLACVLRQKKAVHTLLPDVLSELRRLVPLDAFRVDVEDQGRLWSRIVKPGAEPERPGLGAVPRLQSRESESSREADGGFETTLILGIGEPAGRLVVRRTAKAFDAEDLKILRSVADLLTLGLRARPLDPPARIRHPFEEGPLV